jgi:hypothetical protein
MYSGTLDVRGQVTVPGSFGWSGGTITDTGSLDVLSGATMPLTGAGTKTLAGGANVNNAGRAFWTGAGPLNAGSGGGAFNNLGAFLAQNDGSASGVAFTNAGNFTKSGTTGTTSFFSALINIGTLNVGVNATVSISVARSR